MSTNSSDLTYRRIGTIKVAASIISCISKQNSAVPVQQIADETHIPKAKLYCYLATLEDLGWLDRVEDRYELGMSLAVFWARKKSNLEAENNRIREKLKQLEVA